MEFSPLVITAQGQALMSKLVAGSVMLNFTKISLTDTIFQLAQLPYLSNLGTEKQTVPVENVSRVTDTSVRVRVNVNNTGLTTGYDVETAGVYATDPDAGEILFAVSKATVNGYMPPDNGTSSTALNLDFILTVTNTNAVNLTVNPAGVATLADLAAFTQIHIGPNAPTDPTVVLWIDTSDE